MTYSEDVYDVARHDPPEMVCRMCGAQFAQWISDDEYIADTTCPACGSTEIRRQKEEYDLSG
jgi:putative FmdB family regulatory protein